jgi:hypothetical protein
MSGADSRASPQDLIAPAPSGARVLGACAQLFRTSLRRNRALASLVLPYVFACYALGWAVGGGAVVEIGGIAGQTGLMVALVLGVLAAGSFIRANASRRTGPLREAFWRDLEERWLANDRLLNFLVPTFLIVIFIATFGSFKRLIPYVVPFAWDETFMRWDRWLHGADPWLLLQPIFGTPALTAALNIPYVLWIPLVAGVFVWQGLDTTRPALRQQFLLAFVLNWIMIGTVLALIFSSAGPCYFGRVTGLPDPYVPLVEYLRGAAQQAAVWAPKMQDVLWLNHQANGAMPGSGISAMPSMHVAIAVLLALLGWRINRWIGITFSVFAVLIQIGSVHLAWHYAIDGYLAGIAAAAIWYAVGRALRRAGIADPAR